MSKIGLIVFPITLFLVACSAQLTPAADIVPAAPTTTPFPPLEITASPTVAQVSSEPIQGTATPNVTAGPNCLGEEINPIGTTIADDYPFTSYEQIMIWFCNGAEFEDILVALETESQSGFSAEEMLEWISQGYTWDDIWQFIDLSD
ncbi:MAG: hypothetical protein IZT55_00660 [Anaerolineae bacterium]|nr:hypothetical protein [Anaerolineae bacterium]